MWRDNFLILLMKRVSTHVSYNSLYLFHICQPFISYTFYFIYLQTNIIFINICFYLNASQHILIIYSHSNYLVTNQFIIFQFTFSVHAPVAEWYMRTPLRLNECALIHDGCKSIQDPVGAQPFSFSWLKSWFYTAFILLRLLRPVMVFSAF